MKTETLKRSVIFFTLLLCIVMFTFTKPYTNGGTEKNTAATELANAQSICYLKSVTL